MKNFKQYEGMTIEGSTKEQRHEIWKMLFELNLITMQYKTIEEELNYLEDFSFYNCFTGFIADASKGIPVINIPFEEFKSRLIKKAIEL